MRWWRWLAIVAAACAALPLAIILAQLLVGLFPNYGFFLTSGAESYPVYSIWKVQHGFPLYEWPQREHYQLTLYNVLFYESYAWVLKALGMTDAKILLGGRLITCLFALLGAWGQYKVIGAVLRERFRGWRLFAGLVCFATWFNSYFPGFFCFTVRPDFGSVCFSTWALYWYIRYLRQERSVHLVVAALLWVLGFSFKQATVSLILGAHLFLLCTGRWRAVLLGSAVFFIPVILTFASMGEIYRWNILTAPSVNSFNFRLAGEMLEEGVFRSGFCWTFLLALPLCFSRGNGEKSTGRGLARWRSLAATYGPELSLLFMIDFGGLLSFVALAKEGSNLNQVQEVFVAAATLSTICFIRLAERWQGVRAGVLHLTVGALLATMAVYPWHQINEEQAGPLTTAGEAERADKRAFGAFLQKQPTPLFIRDEIYSLPWFSSGGHYPATTIDPIFYFAAKAKGKLEGDGLPALVQRHYFAALYISPGDELYQPALAAGYIRQPLPAKYVTYLNAFAFRMNGDLLLTPGVTAPP